MYDSKKIKRLLFSAALGSTMALSLNGIKSHADTTQSFKPYTPVAYDISEFQGRLNDQEVMNLKNEVKFVVLRIQDGLYHDQQVNNNISLMDKYGIPYGVYSYSRYTNSAQAREEAKRLHSLAPNARFYANDFETGFTNTSDQDAVSWAHEMKRLTKQPVILYSSQSILDKFQQSTLNAYSAVWLANYSNYTPNPSYNYDLWQYTDKYQSKALGEALDADTIPLGGRKLAFWTTEKKANGHKRVVAKTGTARHIKAHATANVLHKAAKKQVIAKTTFKKAKKVQYTPLVNKVNHNTKKHAKRVYHVKKQVTKKIVKAHNNYKYASATKRVKHNKIYKKHVKKHVKKHAKKSSKYSYKLNNATKTRLAKHHLKKHKKHHKKYSYKLSKNVTRKLTHKHAKHKKHAKKYSYRVKKNLKHKKLHHSYKTKKHNKAKRHYKYNVKKIHHKHAKKYSYRVA